ncbi:peptidoglycan-binding protein [Lutimaribacter sp. EGI FJ00015]|uniref:Peptidoglycan-binding protein n=1 Tax=Lutimaribacter degradans TaxID=2945989 RepID=A0ACC5ZR59_9RHOB|nr:peptidoglycan-binding domain-containing protein [Lutimaribacter sp. EGI FJ00013]MCM2560809.1 peptidoglycan-binding protein [Lutimaribacter sp. EGI FJ00013]MCO0612245.1 peptidoglycan-binding protein [Lutimaribacter sp. EGI FJ00015]MCO0634634.1 peptidoglycan-binding protein [Lutimaribacter sp. EGI FJ00014]
MCITVHRLCLLAVLPALVACQTTLPLPTGEPEVTRLFQAAPPGAAPGTCWGKTATPAVIETVTEQVMVQPPEISADGAVTTSPVYRTETRQKIVKERRETWFETPCESVLTPDFVQSLQRALAVRGHYRGTPNGEMDARTRAAVRRYQAPEGLDSGILSLAAARKLGLVAVERPAPDGDEA